MVAITRYLSALLIGFSLGIAVTHSSQEVKIKDDQAPFTILNDVLNSVRLFYVDETDLNQLEIAAIDGILSSLDPYSDYLNQHDLAVFYDNSRGEYFGYGIEVAVRKDKLTIVAPLPNSPAVDAGIKAGDVIIAVNNEQVKAADVDQTLVAIKQSSISAQALQLRIVRQSQTLDFVITPADIKVASVTSNRISDDIHHISIHSFGKNTSKQFKAELAKLPVSNQKLILDLRNNPGGLLREAVSIADLFMTQGTIVKTSGRFRHANFEYKASRNGDEFHQDLIVLINEGSASASEVLAAALKENKRATLIGQTSFGKGTVQSVLPSMPSGTALKLTTARYYTPLMNDIHNKGIIPDIMVDEDVLLDVNKLSSEYFGSDAIIDPELAKAIITFSQNPRLAAN